MTKAVSEIVEWTDDPAAHHSGGGAHRRTLGTPARESGTHDFGGLQTLGPLSNFKLDFVTLVE